MTYAFPHNTVVVDKEGGIVQHHKGMELRDYFAAQALANAYTQHDGDPDKVAEWAYAVADAMMKARES